MTGTACCRRLQAHRRDPGTNAPHRRL